MLRSPFYNPDERFVVSCVCERQIEMRMVNSGSFVVKEGVQ